MQHIYRMTLWLQWESQSFIDLQAAYHTILMSPIGGKMRIKCDFNNQLWLLRIYSSTLPLAQRADGKPTTQDFVNNVSFFVLQSLIKDNICCFSEHPVSLQMVTTWTHSYGVWFLWADCVAFGVKNSQAPVPPPNQHTSLIPYNCAKGLLNPTKGSKCY